MFVAFDSDVMTKDAVRSALDRFTTWLAYRGANVRHVILPPGPDGAKTGLDDYLAAGHTPAELGGLARDPAVRPGKTAAAIAQQAAGAAKQDGNALLGEVAVFLRSYVIINLLRSMSGPKGLDQR